jgi:hypothetical protein
MNVRFPALLCALVLLVPAADAQNRSTRTQRAPARPAQTPRPAPPPPAAPVAPVSNPSTRLFLPLDLPTPNAYRSADGRPGPQYWQQKADYRIRVTLDPNTHRVSGTVSIRYTNNAPQPLPYLWMALEQNLFAPESRGANIQPGDSRWRGSFPGGGFQLARVEVAQGGQRYGVVPVVDDTRMRLDLRQPVASGATVDVDVDFSFVVPEYGADRLGRFAAARGTVYELAQWYPRMYVYDDVNGWNPLPYYGQGEFYLNYGNYDVEITAPADLVVVSGGELLNPQEVYTPEQVRRWTQARTSAATVPIIAPDEVGTPASRPQVSGGMLTWKFRLENARDFAWAASRAFIVDAAAWEDVLLISAYPHEGLGEPGQATEGWEMSTQYLRHTIPFYSRQWFRYPYPVAVNVAGTVGGMEYPGIVFCGVRARGPALFGVTDHEFGHIWFPMIVGSDERRYAWMDEGFNTFMNRYSNLAYYGPNAARAARTSAPGIAQGMQGLTADQPIMTYPDAIRRTGLGFLAYSKPGAGLVLLREYLLGPERFDAAFRAYIQRWAYKHPQPADFFRTIEDVSGEDLDYFWRGWFYTTSTFDQAITAVTRTDAGGAVTIENRGGLVMPATVEVTYEDGTQARRRIPALAFNTSNTFTVDFPRAVRSARLDPDGWLPDVDRANDAWPLVRSTGTPRN